MKNSDTLDQQTLEAAKGYMGQLAWPTVVLGLALPLLYTATIVAALAGQLSLLLAVPLVAIFTYLAYTVLHDAAHGSITGSRTSLRWLNEALGYMAAWMLMIPLTAHRHEHLAHHRHTNDPQHDPDYHVGDMRNSPVDALVSASKIFAGQFTFYVKNRWHKAPAKQNLFFILEIAAAVLPRLAICAAGYWLDAFWLLGVAWLFGLATLLYLFAYIVHRPHDDTGRYVDTSTILIPGPLGVLATWAWMYQNYHSIHHLFPRVPFYHYRALYNEIEDVMVVKEAPVYRLSLTGMKSLLPMAV